MQQGLAGNLLNVMVRNYGKTTITIGNKSYSIQNYETVYDTAKLI